LFGLFVCVVFACHRFAMFYRALPRSCLRVLLLRDFIIAVSSFCMRVLSLLISPREPTNKQANKQTNTHTHTHKQTNKQAKQTHKLVNVHSYKNNNE